MSEATLATGPKVEPGLHPQGQFVRQNAAGDTAEVTHAFDAPRTCFARFRVGAHCDGRNGRPPSARNNDRVRVVVSA